MVTGSILARTGRHCSSIVLETAHETWKQIQLDSQCKRLLSVLRDVGDASLAQCNTSLIVPLGAVHRRSGALGLGAAVSHSHVVTRAQS